MAQLCKKRLAFRSVVSNLFGAFLTRLILEFFISSLIHKFSRVAERVETLFYRWVTSHVVGWTTILEAFLRLFKKTSLYGN